MEKFKTSMKTKSRISVEKNTICKYGDKMVCQDYGAGIIALAKLPIVGSKREEILKDEKGLKGFLCESEYLLVRFAFAGEEMFYSREGYRIGVDGKPDPKKTLSLVTDKTIENCIRIAKHHEYMSNGWTKEDMGQDA